MSAGFLDDWDESGRVPYVHERVDHDLGAPRRDQNMTVAVAPAPGDAGCGDESLEGIRTADARETLNGRETKQRLREVGDTGDFCRPGLASSRLPPRPQPFCAPGRFAQ